MKKLQTPSIILSWILTMLLFSCTTQTENQIDLAGEWAFQMDSADQGIQQEWFTRSFHETIHLPGSMPEQGKGYKPWYNTKFTAGLWKEYPEGMQWFDNANYKPYLDEEKFRFPFWLTPDYHYVGVAWYQKEIEVPENWKDKSIELFLERPHWETQVWVNGKNIGLRNALGVPHRYQIKDALKPGKNMLSIRVDNRIKDIDVSSDAHSITDNTQSNWNGIVGELKLTGRDLLNVKDVKIFPDIQNKVAQLEIELQNETGSAQKGTLKITAESASADSQQKISKQLTDFSIDDKSTIIHIDYPMGDEVRLWDEFEPNLYELTVALEADDAEDSWTGTFGMRDFRVENKGFVINDRPVFLRGTLECAIFPKTGYPPTESGEWERIIHICKEHGLNHIRFHSWCPPKAAFEAADKLGFYYQVEASVWIGDLGAGAPVDKWIYEESERMVDEYGNHPSFCLMTHGNEPHGPHHVPYLKDYVKHWKERDDRRVYTSGAGYPVIPENDYHNVYHGARIQGWNANLNSIINKEPPQSNYDWEKKTNQVDAPVVSHEMGQWCVYPNLKEIEKYDGVLKATNFEIFKRSLDDHGLLHLADSFKLASCKLQALCYKADIEAGLRTRGFGGFQLLDLHDFPGQGTALVGILDPFWEEKGYITPEEFRQFCNQTVPLARFNKMIFTDDEAVEASIEVAHYGKEELKRVTPTWTIRYADGQVYETGHFGEMDISWGNHQDLGAIHVPIKVQKATQFKLAVDFAGFVNTWDFWVYPAELPKPEKNILITSELTNEAITTLEQGGKVLPPVKKGSIKEGQGGEVAVGFSSIFWNTAWTNGQQPHTLGILCDPNHPALSEFPTEYHSNWQWWDAMSHSDAISLESFLNTPETLVRIIDDWVTNRDLALIFEAKVGKGKLIVSGVDLQSDLVNRPEARQLLHSLTSYMESDHFNPEVTIDSIALARLFR